MSVLPPDDSVPQRHGQPGYFALADLPQRGSVAAQAYSTGWWEFDELFKFYPGQFTMVTGVAGSGKSTLMLNIVCNVARESSVSSFLYVPENEPYLRDKLAKIWNNDDTFDHFAASLCYVQSATPYAYDEPPHTLDWVLDQAVVAVREDGIEIVLIDPWNELERAKPKDMLMTDYIGQCLMQLKQFCRIFNVAIVMVAHPTKAVIGRKPTLADIEGSMNWYNKCDNGLIVFREGANTIVESGKVREVGAGRLGECVFTVDAATGLFKPQYGGVTL